MKSFLRIRIIKEGRGYTKIGKEYRVAYTAGKELIDAGIAEDIDKGYVSKKEESKKEETYTESVTISSPISTTLYNTNKESN